MVNNSIFTEFGRALRRGDFQGLHPDSAEYVDIWKAELDKCVNGISYGGVYMPGRLYSYVNFGTIELLDESTGYKKQGLPFLRDVEWEVFKYIELCLHIKKGFLWVSGRRGGKSYISSWLCAYDFVFNSSAVSMSAGSEKYLMLAMQKIKTHLDGLTNTDFYIPRIKDKLNEEIVGGWRIKDKLTGTWVDKPTGGIVYAINFFSSHQASVGRSSSTFVFEEIGAFEKMNLIASYGASEPCWKEGSKWYGIPFLSGTGGDMAKGSLEAYEMFYDPETYNLLTFFDEDKGKNTAYFLPGYMVLNDFKDDKGITKKDEAIQVLLDKRDLLRKGKKLEKLFKEMQYYPLTPEEAFLKAGGNSFPVELLQQQIEYLVKHPIFEGARGKLEMSDHDKVKFIPDADVREANFPVRAGEDNTGCVVIYEFPLITDDGVTPYNLYVAGTDPYTHDLSESRGSYSLGSTFIYKRVHDFGSSYDTIVAEYTGRPATVEEYFENLRKLLVYYNAKTLYENMIPGLKQYFDVKGCMRLLAPQPSYLRELMEDSTVNRHYGVHASVKIRIHFIELIRTYLLAEPENDFPNVKKIRSINLLRELIAYEEEGNYDRVDSFGLTLMNDLSLTKIRVSMDREQALKQNDFFKVFFKRWRIDSMNSSTSVLT